MIDSIERLEKYYAQKIKAHPKHEDVIVWSQRLGALALMKESMQRELW